jgi:hypothetical protein
MDPSVRLRQALRALLVVATLCLGLAAALAIVTVRWRRDSAAAAAAPKLDLEDPAVRNAAIAELVAGEGGGWDTFPDAEVGRLLQPGIDGHKVKNNKFVVSSNAFGLREKPFVMPKPAGTTRVVLLGDSFVFGEGVDAADRLGVFLQDGLTRHATGNKPKIECLHLGMTCWNIVAETAFLKRALSLVEPDLVFHVVIRNDLEDNPGTRGFGRMADFDPRHGERGEPLFQSHFPSIAFGLRDQNWIAYGLDWESRTRFEEAGRRVAELARLVEAGGGHYLMVDYYIGLLPASRHFIASRLRPEQVCYLPTALMQDDRYRISSGNPHWNRAGHELVARIAASLIRSRDLLPQLRFAEWPEADAAAKEWLEQGEREAAEEPRFDQTTGRRKIRPAIDFTRLDDVAAAQITGGVIRGGLAGPYAALVLQGGGARRLTVAGHGLARRELDGTKVTVFAEEAQLGEFRVSGDAKIDLSFDLPEPIAARPFISVRFVADDYAYAPADLRQHVVFALARVALTGG